MDSKIRQWLLRADPNRPDPGGVRAQHRREFVRRLEQMTPEEVAAELKRVLAKNWRDLVK